MIKIEKTIITDNSINLDLVKIVKVYIFGIKLITFRTKTFTGYSMHMEDYENL